MAAEPATRLTTLPGFDTAPDVYETPDLAADDNDTTTASTSQTSPRAEAPTDTSEEEEEDEGVSNRRLHLERARHRFGQEARGLKTSRADLSDRVDGRRRGFRRGGKEVESLQEKIARLKREVEECRVLAEKEKQQDGTENEDEGEELEDVDALSQILGGIEVPPTRPKRPRTGSETFHDATDGKEDHDEEEDLPSVQPLTNISAFDSRLASLETALGLSSISLDTSSETTPLLPILALLDSQLAALNSANSLSNLEAASSRISKLKAEAQNLSQLQHQTDDEDEESASTLLAPGDMKKLESLYTLLPTLQSLSPTVPALITRLRSLRTLHTTAASASADLDSVEQRQAEMDRELKMWREGLEKVERAVATADEANGKNGNYVKTWVEDLEKRMNGLGR